MAESFRLETSVKASSEAAAKNIELGLTADKINAELSKVGLPKVTLLEAPKVAAGDASAYTLKPKPESGWR